MVKRGRAERAATAASRTAGSGVGAGVGTALSSPFGLGLLAVGALLVGLFIFKDKISEAFGSLKLPFSDVEFPSFDFKFPEFDFKFPEFDFKFPEIKLPEFDFPDFTSIFSGFQDQLSSIAGQVVTLQGAEVTIPPDTMIDPETGIVTSETPPTIVSTTGQGTDLSTLFGELRPKVFDTLIDAFGLSPKEAAIELRDVTTIEGLNEILQSFNQPFIEAAPANVITPSFEPKPIQSFIEPIQQFTGGGVSFIGGSIFETPIENLSLSQIIDKFGVTASQAANLKAIATGFTPEEEEFLKGSQDVIGFTGFNPPAVSDPQFQGLTPQQIAFKLTGGNIQNF